MSYDCPDFVDDATGLLAEAGYTFHERTEDNDGQGDATVHWFAWTDGNMDVEVGEDCPDPLVATMTALRHWMQNTRILSCEEEKALDRIADGEDLRGPTECPGCGQHIDPSCICGCQTREILREKA